MLSLSALSILAAAASLLQPTPLVYQSLEPEPSMEERMHRCIELADVERKRANADLYECLDACPSGFFGPDYQCGRTCNLQWIGQLTAIYRAQDQCIFDVFADELLDFTIAGIDGRESPCMVALRDALVACSREALAEGGAAFREYEACKPAFGSRQDTPEARIACANKLVARLRAATEAHQQCVFDAIANFLACSPLAAAEPTDADRLLTALAACQAALEGALAANAQEYQECLPPAGPERTPDRMARCLRIVLGRDQSAREQFRACSFDAIARYLLPLQR